MNITLKPEYERSIAKQIAKGRFASVDEVLDYVFELLAASEVEYDRWVEQTQPKVKSAIEQLDRGEGIEADVVIAEMRERLASARENRT